ncbi:hypothetical protein [Prochlorococcus marinus]|nr:hypothetical protein [Prochlorococcus marinus]
MNLSEVGMVGKWWGRYILVVGKICMTTKCKSRDIRCFKVLGINSDYS